MKESLFSKWKQRCIGAMLLLNLLVGVRPLYATDSVDTVQQSTVVQKRVLTGTVIDASTNEPLVGVNIKVKGETSGTITDVDGKFNISVTSKSQLEVSYIGYKPLVLMVGDLGVMTIKMESDNEVLDEIVVIGEGTQKKVSITGAITTAKGVDFKVPSSSFTSALAGKLAGVVSMTTSGEPGSSSQFYIRGINTFGGVATPLILLDGVEITADDLNRLPAETIESFSVLKDASATAIYGNRGANGVMLVTTKKGSENTKAKVSVSLEASYFTPTNRVDFVDGPGFMRYYNEAQAARLDGDFTPIYSEEQIAYTEQGINPYVYPNVDWFDLMYRSGNMNQRANINVQGGGSRVTYYMSLQANHDTGLMDAPKNYVYDNNINNWSYSFQNNIGYKLTNTTMLDLRIMAQIGSKHGPGNTTGDIFQRVMRTNPVSYPAYFPAQPGDENIIRFGSQLVGKGEMAVNPYQYMLSNYKEQQYHTMNASLNINQKLDFITEGLSFKSLVNVKSYALTHYTHSMKPYFYSIKEGSWSADSPESYELTELQTGNPFLNKGDINRYTNQTFYFDARLDWKRHFGDHNVTAMAMYMMREFRDNILPNRNQGYSGRVTYDYANKYLVEFNFGYNGSERLAEGSRFEFFPAASVGWVVSSEKFWSPIEKVVDYFKVRASYGLVGSDQFDSNAPHFLYSNNVTIGGSSNGFWTGFPGSEQSHKGPAFHVLSIENAGWEHVTKFDVGVDLSLFNQLRITFDYFRDYRDRILMRRASWPGMLGYWGSTPWSNIGEVENKGVELSVNWKKQFGKDWIVDFRGNFTYNKNKYKYKDEPAYPYIWQSQTGRPLGAVVGYLADGLFESEEEIAHWADQSMLGKCRPGDIKYRDVNGDSYITEEDKVILEPNGNNPAIQYGFGINISYKKWDLGAFFNGSAQRNVMLSNIQPFLSSGQGVTSSVAQNMMQWIADDHWSIDNPNPNARFPRLGVNESDVKQNMVPSSFWLVNRNFLRFKTLEVGYNFPHCRVYFSGDNLAVFSPFKEWDPELSWTTYPLSRTFNIGVQLNF